MKRLTRGRLPVLVCAAHVLACAASLHSEYTRAVDLSVQAGPMLLQIERTYSFRGDSPGLIDRHWRFNWESRLTRQGPGVVVDDMNRGSVFQRDDSSGDYYNALGHRIVLAADGTAKRYWDGAVDLFDRNGRLVERTFQEARRFTLTYSTAGRLSRINGPGGAWVSFVHDGSGRVTSLESANGSKVIYRYAGESLAEVSVNSGPPVRYGYDQVGALTRVEDPATGAAEFSYDAEGRLIRRLYADGAEERYEYDDARGVERRIDPTGAITEIALKAETGTIEALDPAGRRTAVEVDEDGRLARLTGPGGDETRIKYDATGRVGEVSSTGGAVRYEYADGTSIINAVVHPDGSREQYVYDSKQRLTSVKRGDRVSTAITYHPDGSIASIKQEGQPLRSFQYDANGRVESATEAGGGTVSFKYDPAGNVASEMDAMGARIVRKYDAQNRLESETAPDGELRFQYDAAGRLSALTAPGGEVTRIEYDVRGRRVSQTDATGVTRYSYDAAGRLTTIRRPGNLTATYRYDPSGNLIQFTDSRGVWTRFEYDAAGRLSGQTSMTKAYVRYRYDAAGRLAGMETSEGEKAGFKLDEAGRPLSIGDGNGAVTDAQWDSNGKLVARIQPSGAKTTLSYDEEGRVSRIVAPTGDAAAYEYDPLGRLVAVRTPSGGVMRLAYDAADRLVSATNPMGGRRRRVLDLVGRLIQSVDEAGRATEFRYDAAGRLVEKRLPGGGRVTWKYDGAGRVLEIDDGAFPLRYAYDSAGRRTRVEYGALGKAVSYEYDASGLRTAMVGPEGRTIRYEYNAAKQLAAITLAPDRRIQLQLDADDRLSSVSYPNGITGRYSYATGRIGGIAYVNASGTAVGAWTYKYDARGNVVETRDETGPAVTAVRYEFDGGDRLTAEVAPARQLRHRYGPGGNRVEMQTAQGVTAFTYDVGDRLVRAGDEPLSYDATGNLVRRGRTAYEYDSENRLTKLTLPDGDTVEYGYDATGQRVWRQDRDGRTWFIHDGVNVIAELADDGREKAAYIHGPVLDSPLAMIRGGEVYFFHAGLGGNVMRVSDSRGEIAATYEYDAFGGTAAATGKLENPLRFASREWDERTGLYYHRARYYDPRLARFLSIDPIAGAAEAPLDLNPYLYAGNNPLRYVDPLGLAYLGKDILAKWDNQTLLDFTFEGKSDSFNADREIALKILRERGVVPPPPPPLDPRVVLQNEIRYLQDSLASADERGYSAALRESEHARLLAAKDKLAALPPPPRTPTLKIPAAGNPAAINNAPSVWNDPPPIRGWYWSEDENGRRIKKYLDAWEEYRPPPGRTQVPNGFMKDNWPPGRGPAPPPAPGSDFSGGKGVPPGGISSFNPAVNRGWFSWLTDFIRKNPKTTTGIVSSVGVALCLQNGGSWTSCIGSAIIAAGVTAAAGPIVGTTILAFGPEVYLQGKDLAISRSQGQAREAQRAVNLANPARLAEETEKILGGKSNPIVGFTADDLTSEMSLILTHVDAIRREFGEAKKPLSEQLVERTGNLASAFAGPNGPGKFCLAALNLTADLQSSLAAAKRGRTSAWVQSAKNAVGSCTNGTAVNGMRRAVKNAGDELTNLSRAFHAAEEVHTNLKKAEAELHRMHDVQQGYVKLVEANEKEMGKRRESLKNGKKAMDELPALLRTYEGRVQQLVDHANRWRMALPAELPPDMPAELADQIRRVDNLATELALPPGLAKPADAQAIRHPELVTLQSEAEKNVSKWEGLQKQMRLDLDRSGNLICKEYESMWNKEEPALTEFRKLLADATTEHARANLPRILAECESLARAPGTMPPPPGLTEAMPPPKPAIARNRPPSEQTMPPPAAQEEPMPPPEAPPVKRNEPRRTEPTPTPRVNVEAGGLLGVNDGTRRDPPAPPPAANTEPEVCQGGINAKPSSGFAGEGGVITVYIAKPGNVARVMVRSTRVSAELKKSADGAWMQPFKFQGRPGPIEITFDAYDASGKVVCSNRISVTSKGLKPAP